MRKRIAVVGDLMIDIDSIVSRATDREARQCLEVGETRRRLGTAGAVGTMVSTLGIDVTLIAAANVDDIQTIRRMFPGFCHLLGHQQPTTTRERFYREDWTVAGPRVDRNSRAVITAADQEQFAGRIIASACDAVIVCDHGQGVVGARLMELLAPAGIPVFADPYRTSDFAIFSGVECLALNRDEEEILAGTDAEPVPKNIIQKYDEDGLWWYRDGWLFAPKAGPGQFDPYRLYFPSMAREIVDTIGAGDQFIAALAAARVLGDNWETAIMKANAAAGIQCERPGIRPVTWSDIGERLKPVAE